MNLAHEAVDRHALNGLRRHVALRILERSGGRRDVTYGQLSSLTNRFANVLTMLGMSVGDHLFVLCERSLELYLGVLGGLKNGCVVSPLFSAFGPEPLETRLRLGECRMLLTSEALYRRKVAALRERLPALEQVLVYNENGGPSSTEGGSICMNCWPRQRTISRWCIRPKTRRRCCISPVVPPVRRKGPCMCMARH
ncbi:AMP-binding protein [Pseudomonas indica]|nr:AMP-binding protein [Pseudomonas indica]